MALMLFEIGGGGGGSGRAGDGEVSAGGRCSADGRPWVGGRFDLWGVEERRASSRGMR